MILYSVDNSVASITLNRPEKRNALNDELIAAIKHGLEQAAADESVRVIVIAGAGKDFCSGKRPLPTTPKTPARYSNYSS
jgi:enoyl-CoA hydratase/carnithine racemase